MVADLAADDDPIKLREVAIGGAWKNRYPLAPVAGACIARGRRKCRADSIDFNLSVNRPAIGATVPPDLHATCKRSQPNVVNMPHPTHGPLSKQCGDKRAVTRPFSDPQIEAADR
jgi:hypothetical protein